MLGGIFYPFRTPVPFWGHTSQIPSSFVPNCPQNETAVLKGLIGKVAACEEVFKVANREELVEKPAPARV